MAVLFVKLLGVEPSDVPRRKVYRWALLVVSRPVPDPFGLFVDQLPEGEEMSLGELADFLRDGTVLEGVVTRFNAEGGIQAEDMLVN